MSSTDSDNSSDRNAGAPEMRPDRQAEIDAKCGVVQLEKKRLVGEIRWEFDAEDRVVTVRHRGPLDLVDTVLFVPFAMIKEAAANILKFEADLAAGLCQRKQIPVPKATQAKAHAAAQIFKEVEEERRRARDGEQEAPPAESSESTDNGGGAADDIV